MHFICSFWITEVHFSLRRFETLLQSTLYDAHNEQNTSEVPLMSVLLESGFSTKLWSLLSRSCESGRCGDSRMLKRTWRSNDPDEVGDGANRRWMWLQSFLPHCPFATGKTERLILTSCACKPSNDKIMDNVKWSCCWWLLLEIEWVHSTVNNIIHCKDYDIRRIMYNLSTNYIIFNMAISRCRLPKKNKYKSGPVNQYIYQEVEWV